MGRYRITNPNLPATLDQRRYARRLGLDIPDSKPITMGEISALIDEAKLNRRPTDKQLAFAADLGIEVTEETTFDELSKQMDARVTHLTEAAFRDNLLLRTGNTITYMGWPYTIEITIGKRGTFMGTLTPIVEKKIQGYRQVEVPLYKLADCQEPTEQELLMVHEA
jgi:hypothetical protein